MKILSGKSPAKCLRNCLLKLSANRLQCSLFIRIHGDHRTSSPVHLDKAFLLQHRVGLGHRVHIDSNLIRKLPHRGQHLSIGILQGGNSHNNLVAQLLINCLIAAEINLNQHTLVLSHPLPKGRSRQFCP